MKKTIMKGVNKFILVRYDILKNISAVVLFVIIMVTTISIICRYVFNNSLSWAEELCCFLLIYLAFMTAGLATVEKAHVTADFISGYIKGKAKLVLNWVIRLLEIVFFVVIAYASITLMPTTKQISPALEIPRPWYYVPVVVMCIYMAFAVITDLLNELFPGYNYWRQRQDELDKIAEAEEAALMKESLESVDEFMDEQEGGKTT